MTNSWKIFAARTKLIEDKYKPSIIRAITKFRSQFISDLKEKGQSEALAAMSFDLVNEDLLTTVKRIYATAGKVGAQLQFRSLPKISRLKRPRKKANGQLGRNEQWIQYVQDYLKLRGLEMVASMTETMKDDINRILQNGVDGGWSIDRIVEELRRTDLVEARASTIARTEVIRAANVGHAAAASTTPYEVNKKWSSAQDHRTRHSHRMVHNHLVDESDFFEVPVFKGDKRVGSEQMLYPGDPKASAGNTVNCRCRVLYVPKTDSNGNLVMRNPNQAPVIQMRRPPEQQLPAAGIAAVLKSHVHIGVSE